MNREEIMTAVKECTAQLGHVPTIVELLQNVPNLNRHRIMKSFGTYAAILRACGLKRHGPGYQTNLRGLFLEWAGLVRKLGKVPTMADFTLEGNYSVRPLLRHYESWRNVPGCLAEYARQQGLEGEWQDVVKIAETYIESPNRRGVMCKLPLRTDLKSKILPHEPTYGAPLLQSPLTYAPTNEAGVIFVFGMVAQQLGFAVTRMQTEFPDCEAMREVEPGRWQRVRIEFEYESKNFLAHMHDEEGCDLIVCWNDNWRECRLEVLELSKVIQRQ